MLNFSQRMDVAERGVIKRCNSLSLLCDIGAFFIQMVEEIARVQVGQLADVYENSFVP